MSIGLKAAVRRRIESRAHERGAVIVEFALVLPIVVVLLLGSVTAGVAYSRAIGLSNAVREGARFGATTVNDANWATAVVTRTRQTQFDDPSGTAKVCSALLRNDSGADNVPTVTVQSSPCAIPMPAVTVVVANKKCVAMVWASRHYEIETGLLPTYQGDWKPQSVAFYERTCS